MRLNIVIGGKAGQGINKISEIVSKVLVKWGYFIFNYRDYPSIIRGGHNFNVLSISDKQIGSFEKKIDGIVALDENTTTIHKHNLKQDGFIITNSGFENLGRDLNIALAGALIKILGLPVQELLKEVESQFHNKESNKVAELGYESQNEKYNLVKLKNKISMISGSQAIAQGAINSGIDLLIAYPMTPATSVMHELASQQLKNKLMVFQAENEIACINMCLGASFAGAKSMTATSGGGFDLMTEALSFSGMAELPLVVYLASRPGPSTGVPTYSLQDDIDVTLRGGHGEFPRIVIAPGDPIECIEKTNEAFYLAEKFNIPSIILSDKHLAESEFSTDRNPAKPLKIKINRKLPGEYIVKANSYEHNSQGATTENAEISKMQADNRMKKYQAMQKECKKFKMIKIHGNKKSKNLIIGWGSTKSVILDAIQNLDAKFIQILYLKPMSDEIEQEIKKSDKVIIIEQNVTGQLGRLIREKTGIKIENRILKYDTRPFACEELKQEILKRI